MSYTTTVPVAVGAPAVPVQVTGPPVGFTLINRADNGGTLWVAAGRNGPQLPLTPGGSLVWADPTAYPYVSLSSAATAPETLVVTDQVQDYANPEAVAAATAAQLAAQGIPSTFLDGSVASGLGIGPGQDDGGRIGAVGRYSSLLVAPTWTVAPAGMQTLELRFFDPALPGFPPTSVYCTANTAVENPAQFPLVWQVPVLGPSLAAFNWRNTATGAACTVNIVGTNRAVPAFRQIGAELGAAMLAANTPTINTSYDLLAFNDTGPTGQSRMTRFNGLVKLGIHAVGPQVLSALWVEPTLGRQHVNIAVPAGDSLVEFAHPSVPVYWSSAPTSTVAGNLIQLVVLAA